MSNNKEPKRPAGNAEARPDPAVASFRGSHPGLSLEGARLLDAACDAFEKAWRDGVRPDVRTAVLALDEPLRPAALKELVELDIHYRRKLGESPAVADYAERLTGLDLDWLAAKFGETAPSPAPVTETKALTITPPCAGERIGAFELVKELGRGAMGVVFLARQAGLKRDVAVKMVTGETVSRATLARFWAEAEVMAEVKHPNVVQVIELGEDKRRPFMAMEFVSGGSLKKRLEGGALLPLEAAALMERVSRGVAAAHELGIVHRDLKPDNVLLDGDTPKVADFGIAKRKAHELTQTKAMMGTPAYMSPEQAAAQSRHVGPAADVWSLGVMLYECLSGKRPFVGESVFDILAKIATEEPPALRTLTAGIPRDLQTIVAKCMTKEPELRYATAKELADDLGRFVRGEPIEARPVGAIERVARWVRRKPTAAAAYGFSSLAVLLALVVFVVFGFWREAEGAKGQLETANGQLATEKKQTEEARDEAVGLRLRAEGLFKEADEARAEALKQKTKADKSRDDALQQKLAADKARAEAERLEGIEADLRKQADAARDEALKQKGLAEKAQAKEADLRKQADAARDEAVRQKGAAEKAQASEAALRKEADAARDEALKLKGLAEKAQANEAVLRKQVELEREKLAVFEYGRTIQVAYQGWQENKIAATRILLDNTSPRLRGNWEWRYLNRLCDNSLLALKGHTGHVTSACFSTDGSRIVTASDDKTAKVWDAKVGGELLTLKGHMNELYSASFSTDGSQIVTSSLDGTARVWDVKTGTELLALKVERGRGAHFSPDGSRIVTGSFDKTAKVWDAKSGAEVLTLKGHTGSVHPVSFSPDGSRIVTASDDNTAKVWDAKTGTELLAFKHADRVLFASFK